MLLIPSIRVSQPQSASPLNSSSLAQKALFVWTPVHGLCTGGRQQTLGIYTGTAPSVGFVGAAAGGLTAQFHPAGGIYGIAGINTGISSGQDCTVVWIGYPSTTSDINLAVLNRGMGSDSMRFNASGAASYIDNSPAQLNCDLSLSLQVDRLEKRAFTKYGTSLANYDWRTHSVATASGGSGVFRDDGAGNYFYINHTYGSTNGHQRTLFVGAFRPLSAAEVEQLFANPWQIFYSPQIFAAPSAATAVDIAAGPGNAVAAGVSATISSNVTVACTTGTAVAAGIACKFDTSLGCTAGNAVAAGISATISSNQTVSCAAGDAVAAGITAVVSLDVSISCSAGAAVAAGVSASIDVGAGGAVTVDCNAGAAAAAGVSALVQSPISISTAAGNATGIGTTAVISSDSALACSAADAIAVGISCLIETSSAATINCTAGNAVAAGISAYIASGLTLSQADIDAIADAVWAHPKALTLGKWLGLR